MVYRRDGKNAIRGIIKQSGTATTATAIFLAVQLIVFHAGYAQFPHLFILTDGCLWKPSFTDKKDTEGKSEECYSQQDKRNDNNF